MIGTSQANKRNPNYHAAHDVNIAWTLSLNEFVSNGS
jgi:hypothetical protein